MKKYFLLIFVGLALLHHLHALDPHKAVNQYVQNHWSTDHGLPGNAVVAVTQSKNGYLWAATRGKLFRFDGMRFVLYDWLDEKQTGYWSIRSLVVGQDGTLWIGTYGRGVYGLKDGTFTNYSKENGLSSIYVNSLFVDLNNHLWVGTLDGHLNCIRDGKVYNYGPNEGLMESQVNSIFLDSKGNLMAGTQDGGLYILRNDTFRKLDIPSHNRFSANTVCEERGGDLWIGTDNGLLHYKDGNARMYNEKHGLSHKTVTKLAIDNDGNIWAATVNGLNRIRRQLDKPPSIDNILKGNWINQLFEDREHGFWVATRGKGLYQLRDGRLKTFTQTDGLPNENILATFQDREKNIWIGTASCLLKFKDGVINKNAMSVHLPDLQITGVAQDKAGGIWVATVGNGLHRLKGNHTEKYTSKDGLLADTLISIVTDAGERLWIGSQRGLSLLGNWSLPSNRAGVTFDYGNRKEFVPSLSGKFRPPTAAGSFFENFTIKNGLAGNYITGIFEDRNGSIYVGTSKGLNRYQNGKFITLDTTPVAADLLVSHIYHDPHDSPHNTTDKKPQRPPMLWLATLGHGIVKKQGKNYTKYTVTHGLPSNRVYQIFEDNSGYFWMSCEKGIFKVARQALLDLEANKINALHPVIYGRKDGMKTEECTRQTQHNSLQTADGLLLFGTAKGLVIVDPANLKVNTEIPDVIIEQIKVDGKIFSNTPSENRFKNIEKISFTFTAPTFISPEKCRFKFQLSGIHSDWQLQPPGKNRTVEFSYLPSGKYTFRVTAANSDGLWNNKGTAITFYIHRTLFNTPLFIYVAGLLLAAVSALMAYFLKNKISSKKSTHTRSALEPEKSNQLQKKLLYMMEIEKFYRDENLSLPSMAEKLSVPTYYLSQLINEKVGKNFYDFINTYRIEEAKKRLANPAESHVNILQIAYDVGFSSKASFNRVFKKYTGITPSQYRKNHQ